MSCNVCTTVCPVHPCYEDLWIAKLTANNQYTLRIKNLGSGREIVEAVTADSNGLVKISDGTWNDFLNGAGDYQVSFYLKDYSQSPSVTTNIKEDFYVFTGFTGQYYNLSPAFSATQYDCILFSTDMIYDSGGLPITLDNQYLTNEDA